MQSLLLLFQGNDFVNSDCPHSTLRPQREVCPTLTACQTCQKAAWKKHHKYECAMLSAGPTIVALTRVLFRLLHIGDHKLLSRETWVALSRLQSHTNQYLSSAKAAKVAAVSLLARSRTGTVLRVNEVLSLYCTVCSLLPSHTSYLLIYPIYRYSQTVCPFVKQRVRRLEQA